MAAKPQPPLVFYFLSLQKKKKKLFPPGVSVGFWSTTHVNKNPLFLRVMSDGGNEIINR